MVCDRPMMSKRTLCKCVIKNGEGDFYFPGDPETYLYLMQMPGTHVHLYCLNIKVITRSGKDFC